MLWSTPEGVLLPWFGLWARSPEDDPHVDPPGCSPAKHIQSRSATVWHSKGCPHEGYSDPDTSLGRLYRLADPAERRLAIDPRLQQISAACWIRARRYKGN